MLPTSTAIGWLGGSLVYHHGIGVHEHADALAPELGGAAIDRLAHAHAEAPTARSEAPRPAEPVPVLPSDGLRG